MSTAIPLVLNLAPHTQLAADLVLPENPHGIIIFAHGSGSSRLSPRNQYLAKALKAAGFASMLLDLLTVEEERIDLTTREFRFNILLLAERLEHAACWVEKLSELKNLPKGYFGASTGAAAALIAAARQPKMIRAVVSRGGRPDLAGDFLERVEAATLLIVGGYDFGVIELNKKAFAQLSSPKELALIPEATHLFEEPGALEQVAELTKAWFKKYFNLDDLKIE